MSHIRYCITNWCFGNETLVAKLQKLSDKFLRLTFNLRRKENVINVMKSNNLLSIKQLYKTEIGVLMFKYHKKLLPQAFENFFTFKSFNMNTRSCSQIIPNYCKSSVAQQSLSYIGPKYGIKFSTTLKIQ